MHRILAAALLAAPAAMLAAPAAAQGEDGEKVNMVILYGDDQCPPSTVETINVCAYLPENDRYRIPEALRFDDSVQNTAWARRVERYEMIDEFGAMSCSPTGAGGFTGCTQEMIEAAYADRREGSAVRFSRLIEAARAERLSTIDADAAAEQERVEQIERQYMERLERERQAPLPGDEEGEETPPDPNG